MFVIIKTDGTLLRVISCYVIHLCESTYWATLKSFHLLLILIYTNVTVKFSSQSNFQQHCNLGFIENIQTLVSGPFLEGTVLVPIDVGRPVN